jgi:hypothetical protein
MTVARLDSVAPRRASALRRSARRPDGRGRAHDSQLQASARVARRPARCGARQRLIRAVQNPSTDGAFGLGAAGRNAAAVDFRVCGLESGLFGCSARDEAFGVVLGARRSTGSVPAALFDTGGGGAAGRGRCAARGARVGGAAAG